MTNKTLIIATIFNGLIGLLSLAGVTYLYISTPKIVSFDMKSTTDTFLNQVAKLNLSESEQQSLIKKYEQNINKIVEMEYGQKNTLVFVKGAVVSRVDDETNNIKKQLAKKMREGSDAE